MIFNKIDPEKMDVNEKRIYNKNLAVINCKDDANSLFKTMSFNHFDNASRYTKCRQLITKYIFETLLLMKKSNLNDLESSKIKELLEILSGLDENKMYSHYKLSINNSDENQTTMEDLI